MRRAAHEATVVDSPSSSFFDGFWNLFASQQSSSFNTDSQTENSPQIPLRDDNRLKGLEQS